MEKKEKDREKRKKDKRSIVERAKSKAIEKKLKAYILKKYGKIRKNRG